MENTTYTMRIEKKLKKESDLLFESLGTNMASAIKLFLRQCNINKGIPFDINLNPKPNKDLKKALKEVELIKSGKKEVKSYNSASELYNELE